MSDSKREWFELRIGITAEEAVAFLKLLADDEQLRTDLQNNPRDTLLRWNIDLSEESVPERVTLPPPEAIARHAEALAAAKPFGFSENASWPWPWPLPHGFYVLYVVHGNGVPPAPPGAGAS